MATAELSESEAFGDRSAEADELVDERCLMNSRFAITLLLR